MSASSEPASAVTSFDEVAPIGRAVIGRPGVSKSARYEYNAGMRGFHARYAGAEIALASLRIPDLYGAAGNLIRRPPVTSVLVDTHVSFFLFSAWSSMECLTYAVNAVGFSISPMDFCDIDSSSGLSQISPSIVIGKKPRPGFSAYFPSFTSCLRIHEPDVLRLKGQHNVSKHRRAVATGGRLDPRLQRALAPSLGEETAPDVAVTRALCANVG